MTRSRVLKRCFAITYIVLTILWTQMVFGGGLIQDISPPNRFYGGFFCHRSVKAGVERWHLDGP